MSLDAYSRLTLDITLWDGQFKSYDLTSDNDEISSDQASKDSMKSLLMLLRNESRMLEEPE